MKSHLPTVLVVALSGCMPAIGGGAHTLTARPANAAEPTVPSSANAERAVFLATITNVDIGNVRHPYLRWVVTLKVDGVVSGPSPGEGFWFAIHSPSQEGIKVGQRYRISVNKKGDQYDSMSRELLD